jgi:ABC-type glycerol-3-phosphate transport system substrate-binding protein
MGAGILYNKAVYEELGLEIPTTWDEFVANNAVIAETGMAPLITPVTFYWGQLSGLRYTVYPARNRSCTSSAVVNLTTRISPP